MNPTNRPSAAEVLAHPYFREDPRPKAKEMFPTFPSKAGQEKRRRRATPQAPVRGEAPKMAEEDFKGVFAGRDDEEKGAGFALRLG
jgi:cell division cycle 2-like protein